jgi:hypothetical protein
MISSFPLRLVSLIFVFLSGDDRHRPTGGGRCSVLGVLGFENVADGGGVPILAVPRGNSSAAQAITNPAERLNARRFDFQEKGSNHNFSHFPIDPGGGS